MPDSLDNLSLEELQALRQQKTAGPALDDLSLEELQALKQSRQQESEPSWSETLSKAGQAINPKRIMESVEEKNRNYPELPDTAANRAGRRLDIAGETASEVLGGLLSPVAKATGYLRAPAQGLASGLLEKGDLDEALSRAGEKIGSSESGEYSGKQQALRKMAETGEVDKSLSEAFPGLFNETGTGLKLQKGGPLDISKSGVGGFIKDIEQDPTTLLTFMGKAGALSRGAEAASEVGSKASGLLKDASTAVTESGAAKFGKGFTSEINKTFKSLTPEQLGKVVAKAVVKKTIGRIPGAGMLKEAASIAPEVAAEAATETPKPMTGLVSDNPNKGWEFPIRKKRLTREPVNE